MILPDFMIREARGSDQEHVFEPWSERTVQNGMSYGVSHAGYDVRIKDGITLMPGAFRLAVTLERFSMPCDALGIVHDKSTWARRGLAVQNTVAEPGWFGHLTLELKNEGHEVLTIQAGDPIAQIVLHQLAAPPERVYQGKYQGQPAEPVPAILEPTGA